MRNSSARSTILRRLGLGVVALGLLDGPASAIAQDSIDPSSALLLSSPASARPSDRSQREQAVESGRYTVRPKSGLLTVPAQQPQRRVESMSTNSQSPAAAAAPSPVVVHPNGNGIVVLREGKSAESAAAESAPGALVPEPTIGVDPAAALGSLLRLSIASAYYSESSASNYSFRNYGMSGPAYTAEARVWLSDQFGVGASYFSSLAGQVSDGAAEVAVGRTDLVWGALIREHFESSSLVLAVEAVESQFAVSSDAQRRLKTKSSGLRLRLDGDFGDWAGAVSLAPKLSHEESAAASAFQSGSGVESYAAGAALERRWLFDTHHQLFVRLQHSVERNLFSGTATRVDPTSGQSPTGVGVTVGTTLIQFGYHWSN